MWPPPTHRPKTGIVCNFPAPHCSPDSKHGGENDDYIVIAPSSESGSTTAPSSGSHVGASSSGEKEPQTQSNVVSARALLAANDSAPESSANWIAQATLILTWNDRRKYLVVFFSSCRDFYFPLPWKKGSMRMGDLRCSGSSLKFSHFFSRTS